MRKKRAMTSQKASEVKVSGHKNERHFAKIIGGTVNPSNQQGKKDVVDKKFDPHSVKSGTYWQIFLYRRNRLETNTIFQGIGKVANLMIECLDVFPEKYEDYLKNKRTYKAKLQKPMRLLLEELKKPKIFRAFLDKSLFDGGNAI